MLNLTRDYLRHIKIMEEKVMHHHLLELKHPQWGSIIGYENHIRIAVLKDEIEVFESRIEPHDTGHLHTTIGTLNHRIKELEDKETGSNVEERVKRWEAEIEESSTEKGTG
tara:strand:- start:797 stop:1129 length:333 start_codon:yes stop_codon:yes gene_type:complete